MNEMSSGNSYPVVVDRNFYKGREYFPGHNLFVLEITEVRARLF